MSKKITFHSFGEFARRFLPDHYRKLRGGYYTKDMARKVVGSDGL